MTLDQIKPGNGGTITAVRGEGALRRRLLDMGLTPKTKVFVKKTAPIRLSLPYAAICSASARMTPQT